MNTDVSPACKGAVAADECTQIRVTKSHEGASASEVF